MTGEIIDELKDGFMEGLSDVIIFLKENIKHFL